MEFNYKTGLLTIHQGVGDDELEITVQVSPEEFEIMKKLRCQCPSAWEGRELDLVKTAKEMSEKHSAKSDKFFSRKRKHGLIPVLILGLIVILSIIVCVEIYNERQLSAKQTSESKNVSKKRTLYDALSDKYDLGDFETFSKKMDDEDKRRILYDALTSDNYDLGSWKEFNDKILSDTESAQEYTFNNIDWWQVLADFQATLKAKPNLTDDEWFELFPEFEKRKDLLQAAFDYDATLKEKNYSNDELMSKFPEFWPNH